MNAPYGPMLQEILNRFGQEICDDPARLRAALGDYAGMWRLDRPQREIRLLVYAAEERVPEDLLRVQDRSLREVLIRRLATRLQASFGVTAEHARWAVETWACALGLEVGRDETLERQKVELGQNGPVVPVAPTLKGRVPSLRRGRGPHPADSVWTRSLNLFHRVCICVNGAVVVLFGTAMVLITLAYVYVQVREWLPWGRIPAAQVEAATGSIIGEWASGEHYMNVQADGQFEWIHVLGTMGYQSSQGRWKISAIDDTISVKVEYTRGRGVGVPGSVRLKPVAGGLEASWSVGVPPAEFKPTTRRAFLASGHGK